MGDGGKESHDSPEDMVRFMLMQMEQQFITVSETILSRIDAMDRRIGDMEANIAVLSRSADDLQQREVALRAAASEDTSLKK